MLQKITEFEYMSASRIYHTLNMHMCRYHVDTTFTYMYNTCHLDTHLRLVAESSRASAEQFESCTQSRRVRVKFCTLLESSSSNLTNQACRVISTVSLTYNKQMSTWSSDRGQAELDRQTMDWNLTPILSWPDRA